MSPQELQNQIDLLKQQVQELLDWKTERINQQITFPLDINSINILGRNFLSYVGQFNSIGVSGREFPLALILSQNNILYYLSPSGNYYLYTANASTDLLTCFTYLFQNGDAVNIYTENQEPTPLVAGGVTPYFVVSVSGNTFKLSTTLNVVFTVSGITTSPTAGAIYSDGRSNYTVASTSLSGVAPNISGTVTCTSDGKPYQFPGITITKNTGTGDSTIVASTWTANGGSAINITSSGVGNQYISPI